MSDPTASPWTSIATWAAKNLLLAGAWWGSVSLAQVQALVGICTGLAVLVFTVLNTVKLWRELRKAR